jgi:hypothetical protein
MKRLISKFIALMLIASIAIPQTFAATINLPGTATTTIAIGEPVTLSVFVSGLQPTATYIHGDVYWNYGGSSDDVDYAIEADDCFLDTILMEAMCTFGPYTYTTTGIKSVIISLDQHDSTFTRIADTVVNQSTSITVVDPLVVSLTPETQTVDSGVEATVVADVTGGDGSLDTVTFTWGDSTPDTVYSVDDSTLVDPSASTITATHTYAYGLPSMTMPYPVSVVVSDGTLDPVTDTATINVFSALPTPASTFTVEAGIDQTLTLGTPTAVRAVATSLDADAFGANASISWGDGILEPVTGVLGADGVTFDAMHTYLAEGPYTVTVTATEYDSDSLPLTSVSDTLLITVVPVPTLSVEAGLDQTTLLGTTTSFDAIASGLLGDLAWAQFDFGDGSAPLFYNAFAPGAVSVSSSYTYSAAGSYTVTVTMNDGVNTASDTMTVTVEATPFGAVLSIEGGDDQSITLGDTAAVQAVTSYSDGSLDWMEFNWGDGSTNDFYNAIPVGIPATTSTHTYAAAGTYTVTVSASDGTSPTTFDILTITVTTPAFAVYAGDDKTVTLGDSVAVTATVTDGIIINSNFNWGDGYETTDYSDPSLAIREITRAHTYSAIGTYEVIVEVEDAYGVIAPDNVFVTVVLPESSFSVEAGDDQTVNTGETVYVEACATSLDGTATSVDAVIDWGDTTSSPVIGVLEADCVHLDTSHTYSSADTYTVTITATEYDSSLFPLASNSDTLTITVDTPTIPSTLAVEAGIDQAMYVGTPTAVRAIATGLSGDGVSATASINWGDGASTDGVVGDFSDAAGVTFDSMHTYASSGTYTVTVTATEFNSDDVALSNGSDTLTVTIKDAETTTPPTDTGSNGGGSTYGGGAGSSHSSSSSSSTEDDQEVVVAEDGTTVTEDDQTVIVAEEDTTVVDVCSELPFTDVSPNASYYDAIYQAWCDGIVHGRTATTFDPTDAIQRGEVAKVVAGIFGYSPVADLTETSYSDLDSSEPLAPYIEALTEAGILEGYTSEGTFRSHQGMTISEIEALMYRLTGTAVDVSSYSDDGVTVSRGRFMEFILQYLD